jgi:hypothetical protein
MVEDRLGMLMGRLLDMMKDKQLGRLLGRRLDMLQQDKQLGRLDKLVYMMDN